MTINWSPRAARQLWSVWEYIAADNSEVADRVIVRIREAVYMLTVHPQLGRPGRFRNRRELVVDSWVVIYGVRKDEIFVISIKHGAQRK